MESPSKKEIAEHSQEENVHLEITSLSLETKSKKTSEKEEEKKKPEIEQEESKEIEEVPKKEEKAEWDIDDKLISF